MNGIQLQMIYSLLEFQIRLSLTVFPLINSLIRWGGLYTNSGEKERILFSIMQISGDLHPYKADFCQDQQER
jgi:hypothetical protein